MALTYEDLERISDEELKKRFDQTASGNIYQGPVFYATVLHQAGRAHRPALHLRGAGQGSFREEMNHATTNRDGSSSAGCRMLDPGVF